MTAAISILRAGARAQFKGLTGYITAIGVTCLCTALTFPLRSRLELIDIVMIYLLATTLAALRLGRGPALTTSIGNLAAFDYFFVPPRFSFSVADSHYLATLAVMLGVALIISDLVSAVRSQTVAAAERETRTAALYAMTRELAVARDAATMAAIAERHIAAAMQGAVCVALRAAGDESRAPRLSDGLLGSAAVRCWVVAHQRRAGLGTDEFPDEPFVYLPLIGSRDTRGVLVVRPASAQSAAAAEQHRLLDNLASQLAQGLDRVLLQDQAQAAQLIAERSALRNTLLASISHDLRTPLAAIAGAGSMISQNEFALDLHRRCTLGRLIEDKARDMTELLSNVLELMRLEAESMSLRCEWHSVEDLVGLALRRNGPRLSGWEIRNDLPSAIPLIYVEAGLIVQMLSNLFENCAKHAAGGNRLLVGARVMGRTLSLTVEDDGAGLPAGDPERLFDKFERGVRDSNVPGVGLGLAICRAVAQLHGGDIRAGRVESGGARFDISLPLQASALESPGNDDD